ncbi:hypothetical protein ACFQ3S_05770 [Mucilaginibacter terrae]|uniref:hypothetical protein n=1 Tax=Mucilaginibacter terrae TaxID=1955052 RepID=UPI003636F7AC
MNTVNLRYLALTLCLTVLFTSCKKELYNSENKTGVKKNYVKLEKPSFDEFLTVLEKKSPSGFATFNKGKKTKGRVSLSTGAADKSIVLETDSIKKIINAQHTTFTIPLKLTTPHAVQFQNLVVDIEGNKVTSFMLTYYPDIAFRQSHQAGRHPYFTGKIKRTPFNLGTGLVSNGVKATDVKVLSGMICTTTRYVTGIIIVPCDGGPNHGLFDENCTADNPAHFEFTYATSLDCDYIPEAGGGGGGGGGGGNPPPTPPVAELPTSTVSGEVPIVYPSLPPQYTPCTEGTNDDPNGGPASVPTTPCDNPIPPQSYSALTTNLQNALNLTTDQADLLNVNPNIAGKIAELLQENVLPNGTVSEELKALIRDNITAILNGTAVSADPANNNTGETDDFSTENYDYTDYGSYQQNDPWPTVKSVIPADKFVKYDYRNCLTIARAQIAKVGNYTISGYDAPGQTFKINTKDGGIDKPEAAKAASYMKAKIAAGIPIVVGVDYMPGAPDKNYDGKTDHFVVITGMGTDATGQYFSFFDGATAYAWYGTSSQNKIYYNAEQGIFRGVTQVPFDPQHDSKAVYRNSAGKVIVTITHVRKTK